MDIINNIIFPNVHPHTVQLLIARDEKLGQFGTGVLLRVADVGFLLTAAHVADYYSDLFVATKAKKEGETVILTDVARTEEALSRGNRSDGPIPQLSARVVSSTPMPEDGRSEDDLDVAVFELTQEMCTWIDGQGYRWLTTYRLSRADASDLRSALDLYVLGYPGMHGNVDHEHREIVSTLFCWKTLEDLKPGKRQNEQYEISMHMDGSRHSPLSDLRGMSGGGVWATNSKGDVMLVGIQHSQNVGKGVIRATHVSVALSIIEHDWSELRGALNIAVPFSQTLQNMCFEKTSLSANATQVTLDSSETADLNSEQ